MDEVLSYPTMHVVMWIMPYGLFCFRVKFWNYQFGQTPWMGYWTIGSASTRVNTRQRRVTSMPWAGLEPTITVLEPHKTERPLGLALNSLPRDSL